MTTIEVFVKDNVEDSEETWYELKKDTIKGVKLG